MKELEFDRNGYLVPYNIIETTWEIFEEQLVFNSVRANIYIEFKQLCLDLKACGVLSFDVWIDGSFTSLKAHPNDMDLVCFVAHELYTANEKTLRTLRNNFRQLDIYFVKSYPEEHPKYFLTNFDMLDWLHFFTRDRRNNKKGILKVKISNETVRSTSK